MLDQQDANALYVLAQSISGGYYHMTVGSSEENNEMLCLLRTVMERGAVTLNEFNADNGYRNLHQVEDALLRANSYLVSGRERYRRGEKVRPKHLFALLQLYLDGSYCGRRDKVHSLAEKVLNMSD